MATLPDPRCKPIGGPLGELARSPIRRKAGAHSVRVSTIGEITLTCDESDGEYVALELSVAAPEDDPGKWAEMGVAWRIRPSKDVLVDPWIDTGPGGQGFTNEGLAEHCFQADLTKRAESIQGTSGLLALDYPPDVPFIIGHLELDLFPRDDEECWDEEVEEDGWGPYSPGVMHQVRIPIVVGAWSMPDVQFRFPQYRPTVDFATPEGDRYSTTYSQNSVEVIWSGGRYLAKG